MKGVEGAPIRRLFVDVTAEAPALSRPSSADRGEGVGRTCKGADGGTGEGAGGGAGSETGDEAGGETGGGSDAAWLLEACKELKTGGGGAGSLFSRPLPLGFKKPLLPSPPPPFILRSWISSRMGGVTR